MDRRGFIGCVSGAALSIALPEQLGFSIETPSDNWRTFEVTTRVELLEPKGASSIWLPIALAAETPYQKTLGRDFKAEGGTTKLIEEKRDGLTLVYAQFPDSVKPAVSATSKVSTRNVAVDLSKPLSNPGRKS